jgi:hypothetical protein
MIDVMNDIQFNTKHYLKVLEQDPNHRYRSWEHCYNFFKNEELFRGNVETGRLACLNLGFYLASRGMYSGLNGLLWKDYTVYSKIVDILMNPAYSNLWGVGITQLEHNHSLIDQIFELNDKITKTISSITYQKQADGEKDQINPTDALVTKIMFATMGCVPSYDTRFKKGCSEAEVPISNTFDKASYHSIIEFYGENKTVFQHASFQISNNRGMEYPDMKVIDLYFRNHAVGRDQ